MDNLRTSSNLNNNDILYNRIKIDNKINKLNRQIESGQKIQELRDNPIAAAHSTRYKSNIARLSRFQKNIEYGVSNYNITESYLQESIDILSRLREITLEGANSILNDDQRQSLAKEVDELLKQVIDLSNGKNALGEYIFSGSKIQNKPFQAIQGRSSGSSDMSVISEVKYLGDIYRKKTEIDEGKFIELSFAGNKVFWAEPQVIVSDKYALNYFVKEPSIIEIDDKRLSFFKGDNMYTVMSKINNSEVNIKAELDETSNSLILKSTLPSQIWIKDIKGTIMQDLGIIKDDISPAGFNISNNSLLSGSSVFDFIIKLRDSLFENDTNALGSSVLNGIDKSMNNMVMFLGDLGAINERMQFTFKRLSKEELDVTKQDSIISSTDIIDATVKLNQYQALKQATLGIAGKVLQPTLMDFIK